MRKDIKAKWIRALRSGKYRQGDGQLRNDDKFCCLGVLCDIHAKATGEKWDGNTYAGVEIQLPVSVAKWARIPKKFLDDHSIQETDIQLSEDPDDNLSTLNDSGHTFKEIADVIKEKL